MCRAPASARRTAGGTKTFTNGHADDTKPVTVMNRPLQLLFLIALVCPPLIAARLDPAGAARFLEALTQDTLRASYATPLFAFASLCLAVERVVYTFVWCCPERFLDLCVRLKGTWLEGKTPVDVIVNLFTINKFFQYGGFILFFFASGAALTLPATTFDAIVGAQLVAIGQILNIGIYRAIGKNGVYYGCKFNQHVNWCTGFPFNVVTAHPQYLGSVLTTFGACLLTAHPAVLRRGWFGLAAMQALQYAYMSYVEHNL
mmetsp:Transcript_13626/g.43033  ORF Transcript_13626/g.43033 Transcript_13626/m.43033 type:complete len:259 (-) Transcript_13626:351-1127(-)